MIAKLFNRAALGVAIATLSGGLFPATAGMGDWADGIRASARLMADGIDREGNLQAGIEILLPPGWKTYWRDPGDAGIAPVIDFTGSVNVGEPEVHFPPPHRFDDGYSVSNVYTDRVVLPVTVPIDEDADKARLVVKLDIGVCEVICVPDSMTMSLDINPDEKDAYAGRMLEQARAALPTVPIPETFAVSGVSREGGTEKRPIYTFETVVPDADTAELFVEAPDGWFSGPPQTTARDGGKASFRIKFSRLSGKTPVGNPRFSVVISSGGQAVQQVVTPSD